jgi:hypothetical protein
MNLGRTVSRVALSAVLCGLIQFINLQSGNFAVAGTINQTGLVINYDHSSFTADSSTVRNLVPNKPNATLRSNTSTSSPTLGGSTSRNYFVTTENSNTDNSFRFDNKFLYTDTITSAAFGDTLTVSAFAWIYPTKADHVVLEERGSNYNAQSWYDTQIEMVAGTYKFRVWNCGVITASSSTALNAWHYVGFTYNDSTKTIIGYINGIEVARGPCTRESPFNFGNNLFYGVGTNAGTDMNGYTALRYYGGFRFGALHIYNRALSAEVVSTNYNTKISQEINLASLGGVSSKTYPYSQALSMSTSGTSGSGSVAYAIAPGSTAANCTLSNSTATATLTATTSGVCLIRATISADTFFDSATSTNLGFTFNQASQSLSFATTSYSKVFGETQTVTATSAGTGTITYTAGASTACSVSGEAVTITAGTGSCAITASRASDTNYLAANSIDTVTITVSKANQIGFALTSTSGTYLTNLSLNTSGGNGAGAVSYATTASNSAGCSIVSSTSLTSTSAGTCQVVATKLGNDNYLQAYDTQTVTLGKASLGLGISLTGSSLVKYGDTTTVTYSTNRSLGSAGIANLTGSIAYSTESSTSCSVNSSTGVITMVAGSGACSVKVSLSSDTNYLDTSSATVSVTPRKADTLTVTTTEPTPVTYTGSSVVVTPAISVSGLVNNDSTAGATFTYSRATTCATGGVCVVGETGPGGGVVFYVSGTAINAADGISTGGLYLEAAPSTFSKTTFTWCTGFTNSNTTTIGGTSSAIGTGAMNTKIVSSMCSGGAVYEAANLTLGGKSDWFLPSAGELLQMYNQKSILGFGTGTTAAGYLYWGSNETENWVAASLVPANGVGGQNKAQATPYWPIRAFSPSATTYSPSTTAPTNAGSYTITSSVLTLSGGRSTDNYLSVIYDTSTLTIDKANQSIFSNYSSLEAVLGSTFTIYPFGGSGDGAVYLSIANGSSSGCAATTTAVTASTAGTCILTVTKSANENYNQAQSSFTITFFYFVPVATPQVSTTPTQIAIDAPTAWSAVATAAPEITSFTPSSGSVGTVVTVTGTGFDGVTSVKIGRKALITVNGVNSTTLTAVIPAGTTSGPIVVTNEYGSDFSDSNFTVTFVDTP